ncbi:MAG: hypothetical protein WC390_08495 [Sulfurimonas sp.]
MIVQINLLNSIQRKDSLFMLLTRDLTVEWDKVPDTSGGIPAGMIQWRIKDYEEAMSKDKPGETDQVGNPVVAKYMLLMHLEGVAPDEAVGCTKTEYFVLGSNTDPMMQNAQTFYDAIGAKSWKKTLGAAQVPWSSSIVATANSSVGAMFIQQVTHKVEKSFRGEIDESTGEVRKFVQSNLGKVYKIGEMAPKLIPCGIKECNTCDNSGQTGSGAVSAPSTVSPIPPMSPPVAKAPAGPPPVSAAPAPKPVSAPPLSGVKSPGGASAATTPAAPVPPVQAAPVIPSINCRVCGENVTLEAYPSHLEACMAKQFQQEA